jgi:hypothetical protein
MSSGGGKPFFAREGGFSPRVAVSFTGEELFLFGEELFFTGEEQFFFRKLLFSREEEAFSHQ